MPDRRSRAQAALSRDLALSRAITKIYRRKFRAELSEIVSELEATGGAADPADLITEESWIDPVGEAWVLVGRAVFAPHYIALTGEEPVEGKAAPRQELSALVQQIIGQGRPITRMRQMIADEAAGISVRSRRLITTHLRDANLQELRQVVKALKSLYLTDFVKTRAGRMALNSALRASIAFEHEAAKAAQERLRRFKYVKIWTTVGDNAVRPWHAEADGQRRDLDDPFDVGGELLDFPRSGSDPGNNYNCRCWVEHLRVKIQEPAASV